MGTDAEPAALPWVLHSSPGRMRVTVEQFPPPSVRAEWCKWFRFHGINPVDVPIPGWIERDVKGCCVRYLAIQRDADGNIVWTSSSRRGDRGLAIAYISPVLVVRVEQGEGPPLPFPELYAEGWYQPPPFALHTMGVDC